MLIKNSKTFLKLAFVTASVFFTSQICLAATVGVGNATIDWDPAEDGGGTLEWNDVSPSTETATVTFRIYRVSGYVDSTSSFTAANLYATVTETNSYNIGRATQTFSYMVSATDSDTGFISSSTVAHFNFIHYSKTPIAANILREDTESKQTGQGQRWNFSYKLRADAYITIDIYPSGSTFTKNAGNFYTTVSTTPIKTVVNNTPRSYQMNNDSFLNTDIWDCKDSSGNPVSNGCYFALVTAKDRFDAATVIDTVLLTVPVNTLRIADISATPITDRNLSSLISYNVNSDCTVKIIICEPGSKFAVASAAGSLTYLTSRTYTYKIGDNLPLNPVTLAVDGTRLLAVLSNYVDSGDHARLWSGVDDAGSTLASGIYVYGISATDSKNNAAVAVSGDDYAGWGSLPINKQATQPSQTITVAHSYPKNGEVIKAPINKVFVRYRPSEVNASSAISLNSDKSFITLYGPYGQLLTGRKEWDSSANTLSFILDKPISLNGEYTLTVHPQGTDNIFMVENTGDIIFRADIAASNFSEDTYVYPNPVKNTDYANFAFFSNSPSTIRLRVYNINGEQVLDKSYVTAVSGMQSVQWDLKNNDGVDIASGVYIYKFEVDDGTNKQFVTKKLILVK